MKTEKRAHTAERTVSVVRESGESGSSLAIRNVVRQAAGYVRVSTDMQAAEGLSIEAQPGVAPSTLSSWVQRGPVDAAAAALDEKERLHGKPDPHLRRQMQRVASALGWLDGYLDGKETLAEGVLSFSDIAVCCGLDWLMSRERYDITKHSNLDRVMKRHQERPSLRSTRPGRGSDWRQGGAAAPTSR